MSATLILGAENLIELGGPAPGALPLQDTTDSSYPTTATVTGSLYDAGGNVVAGASNLALAWVSGTTGAAAIYRAVIADTVVLILGATYEFRALAVDASGNKRPLNLTLVAVKG